MSLAAIIISAAAMFCEQSNPARAPEEVVDQFIVAIRERNWTQAIGLLGADSRLLTADHEGVALGAAIPTSLAHDRLERRARLRRGEVVVDVYATGSGDTEERVLNFVIRQGCIWTVYDIGPAHGVVGPPPPAER